MKMNKQELMTNVNEILDKHFGNTIFTDPVLSITKSAKDNRVLMGLEFEQGGIVLEKELLKLKDVIARIKDFDSGTQIVWLDAILNELGSDYGSLKYRAGYEQGKFDCAMERDKVTVPQFVADWYEEHKSNLDYELWDYVSDWEDQKPSEFKEWFNKSDKAFQTLVNMHQFGYTVEKEKRYLVKMKGLREDTSYLNYDSIDAEWYFADAENGPAVGTHCTRKELESAGFGWIFSCEGIEVEEVE